MVQKAQDQSECRILKLQYLTNNLRYEVEVFDVKASFMKATNIIWLLQVGVVRYAWT